MNLTAPATLVHRVYDRTAERLESVIKLIERRYTPLGRFRPGPFGGWGFLWQPALLGFLALSAIVVGASFSDSPFKLNYSHTWFFGVQTAPGTVIPTPNESTLVISIVLVLGGMVLLARVWLRLAEVVKHHPGAPVRSLLKMMGLWSIPMILAPPLFSRDVYSYAAQGEMVSHGLNPYILGPYSLGSGPFVTPVDFRWGNTPAPYGPLFLFFDGTIDRITGHHELATVVGLRLLEVAAVALLAFGLVLLARGLGRDVAETLVLGLLNPLVLLTIIGGAHNDGLMVAFLVTGIGFAVKKHPVWGLFFCACATAIKAPAALGLVYIAWTWLGPNVSWRNKVRPFLAAGVVAMTTLGVFSLLAGFGFGWVRNLATPDSVQSWAAPATGVGLALSAVARVMGFAVGAGPFIELSRGVGLVLAFVAMIWLLLNADRRGWVRSLGESLLVFVVLGPVVQPWYLVWGVVLLGVTYLGRQHFWLLVVSIVGPFLGLPGGSQLVYGITHASAYALITSLVILGLMLLVPLGSWTQWSWPLPRAAIPVPA